MVDHLERDQPLGVLQHLRALRPPPAAWPVDRASDRASRRFVEPDRLLQDEQLDLVEAVDDEQAVQFLAGRRRPAASVRRPSRAAPVACGPDPAGRRRADRSACRTATRTGPVGFGDEVLHAEPERAAERCPAAATGADRGACRTAETPTPRPPASGVAIAQAFSARPCRAQSPFLPSRRGLARKCRAASVAPCGLR